MTRIEKGKVFVVANGKTYAINVDQDDIESLMAKCKKEIKQEEEIKLATPWYGASWSE